MDRNIPFANGKKSKVIKIKNIYMLQNFMVDTGRRNYKYHCEGTKVKHSYHNHPIQVIPNRSGGKALPSVNN
jgi:hypothetical protein